ncbi:hypothetical protein BS78_K176300 [Paspalum vaginatum]|uniref:DUF4220 domain-containing protein n=1 Tax=Paspalum vaginatum TaxID=158149 RepID=A0A9W8CDK0_9POAL|nr:hypothetical protein BS78_K176300 [Paspalum vaginatum]
MMMGSLSRWINGTSASFHCPEVGSYITNLTSSYTEKSNEASMVSASVIMFMLAGLFFNLNLFSGISDVSAILDPKVRLFLTSALSLFLPVMSYLFSEAKNAAAGHSGSPVAAKVDLPLRAGLILVWMLLVELLRKKVDEIRMRGYSGTIQRAGRVAWLGSLVFFNIRSAGRKAVFSILWILCATKVLQRITFTEVGKRSYAHGKNARLISSYMSSHILGQEEPTSDEPPAGGNELLRNCDYIVMGEDDMEGIIEPTADGYKLQEDDGKTTTATSDDDDDSIKKLKEKQHIVVTVGEVWKLIDDDRNFPASPKQAESLRRMCLSFALFKLLRRRFEHLPAMTDKEVRDSRNLILNGLYKHNRRRDVLLAGRGSVPGDERRDQLPLRVLPLRHPSGSREPLLPPRKLRPRQHSRGFPVPHGRHPVRQRRHPLRAPQPLRGQLHATSRRVQARRVPCAPIDQTAGRLLLPGRPRHHRLPLRHLLLRGDMGVPRLPPLQLVHGVLALQLQDQAPVAPALQHRLPRRLPHHRLAPEERHPAPEAQHEPALCAEPPLAAHGAPVRRVHCHGREDRGGAQESQGRHHAVPRGARPPPNPCKWQVCTGEAPASRVGMQEQ